MGLVVEGGGEAVGRRWRSWPCCLERLGLCGIGKRQSSEELHGGVWRVFVEFTAVSMAKERAAPRREL